MQFSQQFLDELTARSDIADVVGSYVALTPKGGNLFGLCPFHNEKTASFSVNTGKQIYYCFGCHKGGGVINFIMEVENLSFPEAVEFLAKRAGMEVPQSDRRDESAERQRKRLLQLNKEAARWYYEILLSDEGKAVREYLDKRRISRKVAVNFGMGAAPNAWDRLLQEMTHRGYSKQELLSAGLIVANKNGGFYDKFRNRLMLPVIDHRGDVVGFGSRVIDNSEPKYMNTTETPVYHKRQVLYGLHLAKKTKRPNIILCEGNLDVVTLHQAGFDNAVASMGTALTVEQTRLLSRFTRELVLCYDNDNAGQQATERALQLLNNSEFTVKVLKLPNRMVDGQPKKQDADDFIKNHGAAAFENLLSGSGSGIEFRMAQIAAQFDLSDDRGKVEYTAAVTPVLAALPGAVERDVYAVRAAEAAGISPEAMKAEVARARKKLTYQQKKLRERRELNPSITAQPAQKGLRYQNPRSAMAEEGLIRLLYMDSALFGAVPPLDEGDFSSPLLGRMFALLWAQRDSNHRLSILSGELTGEEMSHLTALLQKPESPANAQKAMEDYVAIIKEEKDKRTIDDGADPLALALERNKAKKGYGGNKT
ncbi:MAG: DNA primase [Oscillospiraceae bacterium]|nr:DNA primase [Oscillospiraceae bacterium]